MQLSEHLTSNIVLICGHYGCGKTTLSINMALKLRAEGKAVTVVDLDIVNPYFRISDSTRMLQDAGAEVVAPNFAGTVLDTPSLSPQVQNALIAAANGATLALVDVGGDPDGATALARYRRLITSAPYQMLYVVNQRRYQTRFAEEAQGYLGEIQQASGLVATGIVGNTHLKGETTAQTVVDALAFEQGVAQLTGLPLEFLTAPTTVYDEVQRLLEGMAPAAPDILPVEAYVKTPWE